VLVDIVVFDGLDELDAIGPFEVLRRAQRAQPSFIVRLVSVTGQRSVRAAAGLGFESDAPFRPGDAEILVVPGGGWTSRSKKGAWAEYQRGELTSMLASAATRVRVKAAVCTGAMLWAHAGVLAGRRAATHHHAMAELAALGVEVVDERVVDDGDLVTSGGITSGIDMALWLVERELDADLATRIATEMEYERFRPRVGA
jgi:transcriptional regulator GlxA family with amidase domain